MYTGEKYMYLLSRIYTYNIFLLFLLYEGIYVQVLCPTTSCKACEKSIVYDMPSMRYQIHSVDFSFFSSYTNVGVCMYVHSQLYIHAYIVLYTHTKYTINFFQYIKRMHAQHMWSKKLSRAIHICIIYLCIPIWGMRWWRNFRIKPAHKLPRILCMHAYNTAYTWKNLSIHVFSL